MTHDKHEFCSDRWVRAARDYVLAASQDEDLDGVSLVFSEVFTNAPARLGVDARGRVGWFIRIENGKLEVARGIPDRADLRIVADYHTVLPLARTVFGDDPQAAADAQETVAAATADGRMRREGDEGAIAALPFLAGLHDALARLTA